MAFRNFSVVPALKYLTPQDQTVTVKPHNRRRIQPIHILAPIKPVKPVHYAAHALDVIARFGGVPELGRALAAVGLPKHKANIYRWLYPYPRGTTGRVPAVAWAEVLIAAKHAKVSLRNVRVMPLRERKGLPGVWSGRFQPQNLKTTNGDNN